jgi:hypothetical protein
VFDASGSQTLTLAVIPAPEPGPIPANDWTVPYYVYMLASKNRGTLYTGVTDNPDWRDLFDDLMK